MKNLLFGIGCLVAAVSMYLVARGSNTTPQAVTDGITKVVTVGDSIAIQYTINGRTKVLITRK